MRVVVIALSIVAAAHFYMWLRLVHDPGWSAGLTALGSALVLLAWASVPVTFALVRRASPRVAALAAWSGYVWLGTSFLLVVALGAADALRGVLALVRWSTGVDVAPGQGAQEEARFWAVLVLVVTGVALALGLWRGQRLSVRRVEVTLARLPRALHGTTIVQLSDVHIGPTLGRPFLERVVQRVNELSPDVVAITGDLVDGSVARLGPAVAALGALRARHGVFFVTGNHEFYSGAELWCAFLRDLGVHVLRNERVRIGSGEDSYDLAGVDDYAGRHFGPGQGADLERALAGRDPARELVLLAHQPRAIVEAERLGVGLQLSGHTHGGQIWPFNLLVRLQQPVTSGLVRFGRALIYVSNGTGYWGPPMRLGSPAEITQLVLLASEERGERRAAA